MSHIPEIEPPIRGERRFERHMEMSVAFTWLRAGWRDLCAAPLPGLLYGLVICLISLAVVAAMYKLAFDYILFPALSGFLIVGPFMAIGLYEESRRIAAKKTTKPMDVLRVKAASPGQLLYMGVLLCVLMLLWMRAAVLLYSIVFGLTPFLGTAHIIETLFYTDRGLILLVVGSLVGALFAAFSFAISVFSVPMLLNERTDALTALGTSMAMVWRNLPVMLCWGGIVMVLSVFSILTGMLGFIVIFPVLGHATWHAYVDIRQPQSVTGHM
ncbi:MAG: DUF2189 domain-containing protein [Alphaproteobacteria bacterium]|nr:DUF2189 domain-containing protein [Alphaproteobacteria bacterium]